jgi:hypothetical protein
MVKPVVMLVVMVLVVATVSVGGAAADNCDPSQLSECEPALIGGSQPTTTCCTNLRAQQSCFCQYVHDPNNGKYINSPNAAPTLTKCGIAVPNC